MIAWITLHTMATAVVLAYAWECRRDLLNARKDAEFWHRRAQYWYAELTNEREEESES